MDVQSIEDFLQPISPSKRFLATAKGTTETRSAEQKASDIAAAKAQLVLDWNLPAFTAVRNRRPTYNEKWVRGLYKLADAVASGKMDVSKVSSEHFAHICPKVLRKKGMTEQSVLKHFQDLPIDVDTPADVPVDADVSVDADGSADSQVADVMIKGSCVKLRSWKRSSDNRVLAYPGAIGTITEIEKHAEGGTFVSVSIKPHWFSPRIVEVFDAELELISAIVEPTEEQPKPPAQKTKITKKFYSLGEMQVFEAFKENFFRRKSSASFCTDGLGEAISAIKWSMPTIYPKLKPDTAKRFPAQIEKKEKELAAQKKKKKKRKKSKPLEQGEDRRNAPSMEEREKQLEQGLAERSAGKGGNRRILTPELFLSLGMLLYALFLSGCPMTSGTALPMMLGHIRAQVVCYASVCCASCLLCEWSTTRALLCEWFQCE